MSVDVDEDQTEPISGPVVRISDGCLDDLILGGIALVFILVVLALWLGTR